MLIDIKDMDRFYVENLSQTCYSDLYFNGFSKKSMKWKSVTPKQFEKKALLFL